MKLATALQGKCKPLPTKKSRSGPCWKGKGSLPADLGTCFVSAVGKEVEVCFMSKSPDCADKEEEPNKTIWD